jgi:hypothetical protein
MESLNNPGQPEHDPLELDTLPSDPRILALNLLGMTASELKGIDEKVISGRQSIGGIKADLKKIINDVNHNLATQRPVPPSPVPVLQTQPSMIPDPVVSPGPVAVSIVEDDANQLQFDFYKKIKPEDLEYQLRCVTSTLERVERKVDEIFNILLKKKSIKIKPNGTHNQ